MRYFQYFIISAAVFYVCWIIILLFYKATTITISSDEALIGFAFGGFLSPFICFGLAIQIDKYLINHGKRPRLDMAKYNLRDTTINTYVQEVKQARSSEDIDKLEERFKGAI